MYWQIYGVNKKRRLRFGTDTWERISCLIAHFKDWEVYPLETYCPKCDRWWT